MNLSIPASHLDLLMRPVHGVLATLMPDGQPFIGDRGGATQAA